MQGNKLRDASTLKVSITDIDRSRYTKDRLEKFSILFPEVDANTLARYLIHSHNSLNKAVPLLASVQKWKKLHGPIIKSDGLNEILKGKAVNNGFDKGGRPLIIIRARMHDPTDRDIVEMAKSAIWATEFAVRRMPESTSKYTIFIDRSEAGLKNQDFAYNKLFNPLSSKLFCGRLHRCIIYPSNIVFWGAWNVVKWFLDPDVRDRVVPCMYLDGVKEYIDDENLPENLGGKASTEFKDEDYPEFYTQDEIKQILEQRALNKQLSSENNNNEEEDIDALDNFFRFPDSGVDTNIDYDTVDIAKIGRAHV